MIVSRHAVIALSFACSFIAKETFAQSTAQELESKVDQIFAAYDKPTSPGCALGVVRDGELIYKRGYGMANLELGVPITPQSVFYMASVSKHFTAASIVLAAEQGYLSLDDDVRKYIPELPFYGSTITLRHMLHHTSGLREIGALLFLVGRNLDVDVHPTAELLDLISRQKALNYPPGDEFWYSNTNYLLLGMVIQRATGRALSQFAEENIFKPLGMNHTRFYDDRHTVVPGRVPAYEPRTGGGFLLDWSTNYDRVGAGGLMSSVEDMVQWDRNFYQNKLGKGTLLEELQRPAVLNNGNLFQYGLGLWMTTYRGQPVVGHGGALFGYRTDLLHFPQQKFSVICLCNLGTADAEHLSQQVADIYLDSQLRVQHAAPSTAPIDDAHNFVGLYRDPESHSVVDVSKVDGDLVAWGTYFRPEAGGRFVAEQEDANIVFESQSGGMRMTNAVSGNPPHAFEKFQRISLSTEELAEYVGDYKSSEFEAVHRLAVKDTNLMFAVNWLGPAALRPTIRDEFQGPFGSTMVFRRDTAGRITGYDFFIDRIRNIYFSKQ